MSADLSFDAMRDAIRAHIEELGFALMDLRRAGTPNRPIFQIRVDRPGSRPGHGVTIGDCVRISRSLERLLDGDTPRERGTPRETRRYVLEVSSPGIGAREKRKIGESDGRID